MNFGPRQGWEQTKTKQWSEIAKRYYQYLIFGYVCTDHHMEDRQEFIARDLIITIQVVHLEGNCNRSKYRTTCIIHQFKSTGTVSNWTLILGSTGIQKSVIMRVLYIGNTVKLVYCGPCVIRNSVLLRIPFMVPAFFPLITC